MPKQTEDISKIAESVEVVAMQAKEASEELAQSSEKARNSALLEMAKALRENTEAIIVANAHDVTCAHKAGLSEALIDRLLLNEARIESAAAGLEKLVAMPDVLNKTLEARTLESGIELNRVSVPLGVVAVVYEARPNVTVDAAGICIKSGNACVLRGGSAAAKSCEVLADTLQRAAVSAGLPQGCIGSVSPASHATSDVLMNLREYVDVLIPRGGKGLIQHCIKNSTVPVIETGTGNCHVYVHETADLAQACNILVNAKCRRYGVCNAAETLLVDKGIAQEFLPMAFKELAKHEVTCYMDKTAMSCASEFCANEATTGGSTLDYELATQADWECEYLAPKLAIRCMSGVDAAIEHINTYGTRHSEAIVASENANEGLLAISKFIARVDAACVYTNASTAFSDGEMFGLGAEIGISTQKLHVRGPFSAEALTSSKYILRGAGQVRK